VLASLGVNFGRRTKARGSGRWRRFKGHGSSVAWGKRERGRGQRSCRGGGTVTMQHGGEGEGDDRQGARPTDAIDVGCGRKTDRWADLGSGPQQHYRVAI
jgi:hypothetical protein